MVSQQLAYPDQVHTLFEEAAAALPELLCRDEINYTTAGANVTVRCPACGKHEIIVNMTSLSRHVMNVNSEVHQLIKEQCGNLSVAERQPYHAGVLDLSCRYLPLFAELQREYAVQKRVAHNVASSERRKRRNSQISLDVAASKLTEVQLLEFVACYRKRAYESRAAAVAGIVEDGHDLETAGYEPYACNYCDGWHFGHPVGPTVPHEYRLTRARMVWSTNRKVANRFAQERLAGQLG